MKKVSSILFFNPTHDFYFIFEPFNICILVIQPDTCKHIHIIAFLPAVCILICMQEHTSTLKTEDIILFRDRFDAVMYSLTIKVSPLTEGEFVICLRQYIPVLLMPS